MPTITPSALQSHAGYWLRFVSNNVSHAFRLKVEAHGVTVAEWVILRALFESDGINQSQLAESVGLTRGAISKLVARLEAKRLVTCRSVAGDGRSVEVGLTSSGRTLVPILARLADENDAEFFGHLRAKDRSALIALLKDIVERKNLRGAPVD
jgi:DNA-binding MarR family transcriptional regulator